MSPTSQPVQLQRRTLIMTALAVVVVLAPAMAAAQLQTEAPPPIPGAKPVIVERITVRGAALESNLEGSAADRFQNHVLPFFSRTLCADRACR